MMVTETAAACHLGGGSGGRPAEEAHSLMGCSGSGRQPILPWVPFSGLLAKKDKAPPSGRLGDAKLLWQLWATG